MSYRDWARGEDDPRERRSAASWAEPVERSPAERYDSAVERYRTPSRRRAIERGQEEPAEPYLPRWALESGVSSVDGGGRHAAPDDDDDADRPRYGDSDWRSVEPARSRRAIESGWRDAPSSAAAGSTRRTESDHTREWTFDRPQEGYAGGREEGYVGSRRAEEDDPVSGVTPQSRPRRAQSRRRQVTWSGLEDEGQQKLDSEPTAEPPTRRRRRAAEAPGPAVDPWERTTGAAEPWERTAEPESRQPAVDPWDASGLHVWEQSAGLDRRAEDGAADPWDADSTSQWLQGPATDQWLEPDSTGQWDRYSEVDRRDRRQDPNRWDGYSESDRWDHTVPPRSGAAAGAEQWSRAGRAEPEPQREGFWPGTRLAGDDPRWVDAPASAPRSPVVGYTAPRPRPAPRRRPAPAAPARQVGIAAVRRRIESVGSASWNRRLEDDLLDPDPGGPWLPLLYTAACYVLPAMVIFVWLLTLDGTPPAGCVTDISGGGCDSSRARAFGAMVGGIPRFGLALASSLAVAMLLRRVGTTWRSTTVALAAAVVGGGLSTVMISAVTGEPIG
ncbi:hypothetical protein SAMN05443287_107123 [Micromonospora phaseoli]|uniref:Uncharacterized protein n=1 Tax=Micromonospora phaseoli TaxID=1144548 RepID=A0A1H7BIQ1_9ACTN|nr:hypothetical protein [Micromonospora phaseoli]PZV95099.1 hypothetical protein CLV64_108239 [Micromonospora phaseoli]GIJ81050.1 hypothetical protein Xph01_54820 [Micromonospora phaseoli]SEJ74422.1 hypothetical protein SAMN05443287_107123 [Micromonospora phaseoli]